MAPILQIKPLGLTSLFQMQKQPVHFASISAKQTQPKLFKVAPSIWGDFEQQELCSRDVKPFYKLDIKNFQLFSYERP